MLTADTLLKHTVSIKVDHHMLSYASTSACSMSPNTQRYPMGLRLLEGTPSAGHSSYRQSQSHQTMVWLLKRPHQLARTTPTHRCEVDQTTSCLSKEPCQLAQPPTLGLDLCLFGRLLCRQALAQARCMLQHPLHSTDGRGRMTTRLHVW